jgi:hypothetical protein
MAQGVDHATAGLLADHQPKMAQQPRLVGHGRLLHIDRAGQLPTEHGPLRSSLRCAAGWRAANAYKVATTMVAEAWSIWAGGRRALACLL